jgi:uncharacterized Zn finger protein
LTDRLALDFLGTFESLRMGPTFARGRRDERAGHVRQLTVSGSLVVAQVRGPEDTTAFRARLALRAFGATEWARVEQDLAAEARYAADLLAGRMPPGIEAVFAEAGLSLVPLSLDEVAMDCSCERWPVPCVHLAATIYAVARSFTEDPFGVFTWRGRSRDELLLHLRELRGTLAVERVSTLEDASLSVMEDASGGEVDAATFWGDAAASPLVPAGGRPGAPSRPDTLLDQLDPPPLAHDGRTLTDLLRPAYCALPE